MHDCRQNVRAFLDFHWILAFEIVESGGTFLCDFFNFIPGLAEVLA